MTPNTLGAPVAPGSVVVCIKDRGFDREDESDLRGGLQCLIATQPLSQYFLAGYHLVEWNAISGSNNDSNVCLTPMIA